VQPYLENWFRITSCYLYKLWTKSKSRKMLCGDGYMMTKMEETKTTKQIPSLKEYIFPPEIILQYTDDLLKYYQFCNQSSIDVYEQWKDNDNFKGSLGDYDRLLEMKKLFEKYEGKSWKELYSILTLINAYSDEISFKNIHKLSKEDQIKVLDLISRGHIAYEKIKSWLKPIDKPNVFQAITDAIETSLGSGKYVQFEVLKYADLKSNKNEDDGIKIFPFILEIDDPTALVEYFRLQTKPIDDCLILAFMRNKKYEFKPTVYFFLIWNNSFYILNMGERRFDLDSTAGARAPDKYIDRHFGNVWLPLDILIDGKSDTKLGSLVVRDQKIFKRGNLVTIFEESPEIKAWIDMFTYKILDYVQNKKNSIEQAVLPHEIVKMLEDKTQKKIEERIKVSDSEYHSSFNSSGDASSYLLKKYSSQITSIVPKESEFPIVIGTRKRIEGIVKFKQRESTADSLRKLIYLDWKKNHKRVYDWFKKFVFKHNVHEIIKLALKNEKYPYLEYPPTFRTKYVDGKDIEIKKPTMFNETISRILDEVHWHDVSEENLQLVWTKNQQVYGSKCQICKKFNYKKAIHLHFKDYRQLCAFFNIEKEELPKEFVEHFHRFNETSTGNPIIEDVDPVDLIKDYWFRQVLKHQAGLYKNTSSMFATGEPFLSIIIPVCNRCLKKEQKK